ncbi:hypothetical protein DZC31_06020 [Stenotrophomonas rhizophila]|nr:hypothetical protein DZC31_06020 [Stenotrophomonas rhizophila]
MVHSAGAGAPAFAFAQQRAACCVAADGGVGVHLLNRRRLLRGHARSHRDSARPEGNALPVGAGVPAKKHMQIIQA